MASKITLPLTPELEAKEAKDDIQAELKSEYISGNASSQALLMALKRQSRYEKGKNFNGFVLHDDSSEKDEFSQFIKLLKSNINLIPANTRLQAIVRVFSSHWLVADILIGEKGKVDTFILDAANFLAFAPAISNRFKEEFPQGDHYYFQSDIIQLKKEVKLKERNLQTAAVGCRVFVTEHAKQLSQIDSSILYGEELPLLAKLGVVTPEDFVRVSISKPLKLSRIFRSMQTLTGFYSLGDAVLNTEIKTGETVKMSAEKHIEQRINKTILIKNDSYKAKKSKFFSTLSEREIIDIMQQRQGMTFLANPILFNLSQAIAKASSESLMRFLEHVCQKIEIQKTSPEYTFFKPIEDDYYLNALKTLSTKKPDKFSVLLNIAGLFQLFDNQSRVTQKQFLDDFLASAIPSLRDEPSAETKLSL